jgi:hypothetical protein
MSEIYIEMQRKGVYLKVTAIDADTAEEATALGPINDPEGVKRLAVLKLQNKLGQRGGQGSQRPDQTGNGPSGGPGGPKPSSSGRGTLV